MVAASCGLAPPAAGAAAAGTAWADGADAVSYTHLTLPTIA